MRPQGSHRSVVWLIIFMLSVTSAAGQSPKSSNVDLCNGQSRASSDSQIMGCTALIKSDASSPQVLAVAYNNRGNAFSTKGEYELAIRDYDELIKLAPNYDKPFNNRGVAYQKKGQYDLAI